MMCIERKRKTATETVRMRQSNRVKEAALSLKEAKIEKVRKMGNNSQKYSMHIHTDNEMHS